jgi:hypothetical protein
MQSVWVFNGIGASIPAGVFTSRPTAEAWIAAHHLSGTLTEYPLDVGVYDLALQRGWFTPRGDDQKSPEFIQRFTSASQQHHHYQDGLCCI